MDTSPQQMPQIMLQAEFDLVTNTNHSKKLLQVLWTLSARDMKWGSQVSVTMESPVQLSEILTESSIILVSTNFFYPVHIVCQILLPNKLEFLRLGLARIIYCFVVVVCVFFFCFFVFVFVFFLTQYLEQVHA